MVDVVRTQVPRFCPVTIEAGNHAVRPRLFMLWTTAEDLKRLHPGIDANTLVMWGAMRKAVLRTFATEAGMATRDAEETMRGLVSKGVLEPGQELSQLEFMEILGSAPPPDSR